MPQFPPLFLQGELGAQEGEVQGCSAISQGKGVWGVLRVSEPASPATQCHLPPGQSLHHEAGHQLSAHEEAAHLWSVRWYKYLYLEAHKILQRMQNRFKTLTDTVNMKQGGKYNLQSLGQSSEGALVLICTL